MIDTILSAATKCLKKSGYDFEMHGVDDLRFFCASQSGTLWRGQFLISEDPPLVRLFIFLTDRPYPADKESWVRELILRADNKLGVLGGFGMDLDAGVGFFRYGVDFRESLIVTPKDIAQMLNSTALGLAVWERAYGFVHGHVSPKAALNSALIEAQVYQPTFNDGGDLTSD